MGRLDAEEWLTRVQLAGATLAALGAARAAILAGAVVVMCGHEQWTASVWWVWLGHPFLWLCCVPELERAALRESGWECAGLGSADAWLWVGPGALELAPLLVAGRGGERPAVQADVKGGSRGA